MAPPLRVRQRRGRRRPDASYAGTYRNDLYGDVGVSASGSGLAIAIGPSREAAPMRHFDRDVFTYQPAGEDAAGPSAVTFTVGADRKASAVTIEFLDVDRQGTFRRV
jgi:hypothetical protein